MSQRIKKIHNILVFSVIKLYEKIKLVDLFTTIINKGGGRRQGLNIIGNVTFVYGNGVDNSIRYPNRGLYKTEVCYTLHIKRTVLKSCKER